MKQSFDLQKVIDYFGLNKEELERVLFPHQMYKKQALNRVLEGKSQINVEQLEKLAEYIGIFVSDLFSLNTWKGSADGNGLIFTKGEYKVKVNYNGSFISVYKGENLKYQQVSALQNYSISEFIEHIDSLILNIEKDGKL